MRTRRYFVKFDKIWPFTGFSGAAAQKSVYLGRRTA
jgi:hypothetical protein